jgi:hypothetical protein
MRRATTTIDDDEQRDRAREEKKEIGKILLRLKKQNPILTAK